MRLRVATLNTWALPLFAECIEERVRAIGRRLLTLDVDLIAFQEVWTASARRALARAGERAGLGFAWHRRRLLVGSGLLVLSRLPFEEVDFDRFELRCTPSRTGELLGGKGFAEIRVRTAAGPVTIVDTHLHAGTAAPGSPAFRAQRVAQIVQMASELRDVRDPLLLLGDLNFEEPSPEHTVLAGLLGLRDVAALLNRRQATALHRNPYRREGSSDRRIDYVFARDGRRAALAPVAIERVFDDPLWIDGREAAYSNHAGVRAELEVRAAAGAPPVPDPHAVELAEQLIVAGTDAARRERLANRNWAGGAITAAGLATAGRRAAPTRRGFLRGALALGAIAALAPGLTSSLSAEWLGPVEIRAFRDARAELARLRDDATSGRLA